MPADWYIETDTDPGGEWLASMDKCSTCWDPGLAPDGDYYGSANDDAPGGTSDGDMNYLYTNPIDVSGSMTARLTFHYDFNGEFGHDTGSL